MHEPGEIQDIQMRADEQGSGREIDAEASLTEIVEHAGRSPFGVKDASTNAARSEVPDGFPRKAALTGAIQSLSGPQAAIPGPTRMGGRSEAIALRLSLRTARPLQSTRVR